MYECALDAHTRNYLMNYMKNLFSVLLFSVAIAIPAVADDIYFEADFEKGIPSTFKLIDRDENPTKSGVSRIDLSKGSWATGQYDKGCTAAMSSAFCTYDYPVEDWMILPQINVKDAMAVLAWDAMSVHYDFREDYKVMISQSGNSTSDFVEVYSVQEEDYFIRRHAISLADYEGKDIYIAFVHTGQDKFLLGIDNIKVGEFRGDYTFTNTTDVTAKGGQNITISGTIRNMSSMDYFEPVVKVGDVEYTWTGTVMPTIWEVGEEVPFSFSVPAPEEGTVDYTVGVKYSRNDSEMVWSTTDTVYCSAFPRNILVEKFTGTWCNNCPEGTITLHKYEQRLRNRIITVEGHCASGTSEPMADATYHNGLAYWIHNLPGMIYDRRLGMVSQQAKDDGNVYIAMRKPVTAEIIPTVKYTAEGSFEVSSTVRFSQEYDNSGDRYRVGYIVSENVVHQPDNSKYSQSNSCQYASCREYNFLPSTIPAELAYFHNVGRGDVTAFDGVPVSLPGETLTPYTNYEVVDTIAMPSTPLFDSEYVYDPKNISITAVLIYTRDKSIMAACRVNTEDIDWSAAVENNMQDAVYYNVKATDGKVYVSNVNGRATVRVYAVDGRMLAQAHGARVVTADVAQYTGVAIVSIETENGVVTEKILIK